MVEEESQVFVFVVVEFQRSATIPENEERKQIKGEHNAPYPSFETIAIDLQFYVGVTGGLYMIS
jgi:hypothetical protein